MALAAETDQQHLLYTIIQTLQRLHNQSLIILFAVHNLNYSQGVVDVSL